MGRQPDKPGAIENRPKLRKYRLAERGEPPNRGGAPEYQLSTEIRKFQIVNAPERKAEAEISAKVIAADGHIVAARVFDGSAPVKLAEEADAAKALNEAF